MNESVVKAMDVLVALAEHEDGQGARELADRIGVPYDFVANTARRTASTRIQPIARSSSAAMTRRHAKTPTATEVDTARTEEAAGVVAPLCSGRPLRTRSHTLAPARRRCCGLGSPSAPARAARSVGLPALTLGARGCIRHGYGCPRGKGSRCGQPDPYQRGPLLEGRGNQHHAEDLRRHRDSPADGRAIAGLDQLGFGFRDKCLPQRRDRARLDPRHAVRLASRCVYLAEDAPSAQPVSITPSTSSRVRVAIAEITSDPKQPSRFEKNRNTLAAYPCALGRFEAG
jgi:hypothetical protein